MRALASLAEECYYHLDQGHDLFDLGTGQSMEAQYAEYRAQRDRRRRNPRPPRQPRNAPNNEVKILTLLRFYHFL